MLIIAWAIVFFVGIGLIGTGVLGWFDCITLHPGLCIGLGFAGIVNLFALYLIVAIED